ncbi:MAG: hypothetical protein ACXWIU_16205, partial [Limisphaerales bacterium]
IVLSFTILAYLYKQTAVIQRQNFEMTTVALDYNTNVAPKIEMARTNLEAFARTNPSFLPVLRKYFPTTNAPLTKP